MLTVTCPLIYPSSHPDSKNVFLLYNNSIVAIDFRAGCFEHSDELLGSIKGGEFLD